MTAPGPVPVYIVTTPRRLCVTNLEAQGALERIVRGWFEGAGDGLDELAAALARRDTHAATEALSGIARACMPSFESRTQLTGGTQERFACGVVLGLQVSLRGRWDVEWMRESGWCRLDVVLVPEDGATGTDPAIVMEFKVFDPDKERTLEDTVERTRAHIRDKAYVDGLVERSVTRERIHTFGIALRGKEVLVG